MLSVLKKAEDEDALILRVYNPAELGEVEDKVQFTQSVASWLETSMDERVRDTQVEAQTFGTLKACQAKSFQVKF